MKTIKEMPIEIKTGLGMILVLSLIAFHPLAAIVAGIALMLVAHIFEEELF
jgi:hypothetical protein